MRAIVFSKKNTPVLIEKPTEKPQSSQVLIEIHASGICHTDLEVMRGNYGSSAFPLIPGHEYAGLVSQIGPDVTNLQVGDRVVVDPNLECGSCPACKKGWAHLCETLGAYGVTCDGGFAEYSLVQA